MQLTSGSTVYTYPTWEALLTATTNLVLFTLSLHVLDKRVRQPFLQSLALFASAVAVVAILQLFTSPEQVYWRFAVSYPEALVGPFLNRNQFAAWVELVFPIALLSALRDSERRILWASAAAILFAAVIASASRAGAALITVEAAAVLYAATRREYLERRTLVLVVIFLVTLTGAFTAVVGLDRLGERLQKKDPFETRRDLAQASST